jgi:hypothetical protein
MDGLSLRWSPAAGRLTTGKIASDCFTPMSRRHGVRLLDVDTETSWRQ